MTTSFYTQLPVLTRFEDTGEQDSYVPLPEDWHVAMCDVRDSTGAVAAGKYKSVNTIGAAVITAVLGAAGDVEIPFIFEGDGAVLCVPPQLLDGACNALLQTQALARSAFDLDLRVATMPVARIREAGYSILVARYRVSQHYVQAMFLGGGLAYAERCMKNPATEHLCAVPRKDRQAEVRFDGLECRWKDIPSRHGETVSLMVTVLGTDTEHATAIYRSLIDKVREIYGTDDVCHPVWPPDLRFSFGRGSLSDEVKIRAHKRGALGRWAYLTKTRCLMLLGAVLMKFGIRTDKTDWGRYKTVLARNADVKKVNDCYRQVLAGNAAQREKMAAWLEECYALGELVYGMHVADRAQMTCLVFDYSGRHLHFIDGADGGFFMAAKALKARLAAREAKAAQV